VRPEGSAAHSHYPHWPIEICGGDGHIEFDEVGREDKALDFIVKACTLTFLYKNLRITLKAFEGVVSQAKHYIKAAKDYYPQCSSAVQ
jgi:hypothetical protein